MNTRYIAALCALLVSTTMAMSGCDRRGDGPLGAASQPGYGASAPTPMTPPASR